MKRLIGLTLLVLLWSAPSLAQTVTTSQPFNVAFDHDGLNGPTGFQCVLDGKPLGSPLAPNARLCAIPGLSAGTHTIVVEAVNGFGRAASAPLTVTAGTAPNAPTNLRISMQITVHETGTVELRAFNVEKQP